MYVSPDPHPDPGTSTASAGAVPLVLRELEADSFALRALADLQRDYVADPKRNEFFRNLLQSVSFYFISRQILADAAESINGDTALSAQAEADVDKVVGCVRREGCLIRNLDLPSMERYTDRHPPDLFRMRVVQRFADTAQTTPDSGGMTALSRLVNRNAELLWRANKEPYRASHP